MTFETAIFDVTYYVLGFGMASILSVSTVISFRKVLRDSEDLNRRRFLATGLASIGALIVLTTGFVLVTTERIGSINGFTYLQTEYSVFYIGFGLVLTGVYFSLSSVKRFISKRARKTLAGFCALSYGSSILYSSTHLFNDATYSVTILGGSAHVAQQMIFYLPLFLTCAIGIASLLFGAATEKRRGFEWRTQIFFATALLLLLGGLLRESTIIPSSGNPLENLLIAFAPFFASTVFLLLAAADGKTQHIEPVPAGGQVGRYNPSISFQEN